MSFAGSWYSDSAREVKTSMRLFAEAVEQQPYKAYGAILPHAGHAYSGYGISQFFSNAHLEAKRVIILAPSHYKKLYPDRIAYSNFEEYETPLGNIKGELLMSPPDFFDLDNESICLEHSAEMFYPFIKHYLPKSKMIVFLIPEISSSKKLEQISRSITETVDYNPKEDLIIASSDFTHYGARFGYTPFGTNTSQQAEQQVKELDNKYAQLLAAGKIKTVYENIEADRPSICGIYPAMLASSIMSNAGLNGSFVNYYNSNQVTAPSSDFVCYASVLFH